MIKKYWVFIPALVLFVWAGIAFYQSWPKPEKFHLEENGTYMVPSTVAVLPAVQRAVLYILTPYNTDLKTNTYAITDVSQKDGKYIVSVAALPPGSKIMQMDKAIWLGVVQVDDAARLQGSVLKDPAETARNNEGGGSQNILPFRGGTTALYGTAGVHNCGFQTNMEAVDLFPTENMVYASNDGQSSYICRDSTQVSMRVGDFLYAHMVDNGQTVGTQYNQGAAIGSLVPGSFDNTCGYASQQAGSAHVHFCFLSNYAHTFAADGYALNTTNNNWVKGEETVSPGGTLTATWQTADGTLIPGSSQGFNLWDSLTGGIMEMVDGMKQPLPLHEARNLATITMSKTTPIMTLLNVLVFSQFNCAIPLVVFTIVTVLETARIVYAVYMLIKRLIPVIG